MEWCEVWEEEFKGPCAAFYYAKGKGNLCTLGPLEASALGGKTSSPYGKVKVKLRTLDIATLRESSPQKSSGMEHVLKGSHCLTVLPARCTPTHSIHNRNEPYLPLPGPA